MPLKMGQIARSLRDGSKKREFETVTTPPGACYWCHSMDPENPAVSPVGDVSMPEKKFCSDKCIQANEDFLWGP